MKTSETGSKLLTLLLEGGQSYLSGEKLSVSLGVSRAAVWKEIDRLRGSGFMIESATNRGYRLTAKGNFMWPELILPEIDSNIKNPIIYYTSLDSTNLEANRLLLQGVADGTVVVADSQTAGAGRLGRSFASEPEVGAYFSLVYQPSCGVERLGLLTSLAGLAVCRGVEALAPCQLAIKWPNDVMAGSRKICGILTRLASDAETNTISHAIIGIGVNVLQRTWPEELQEKATSLEEACGQPISRAAVVGRILGQLNRMLWEENWLEHPPAELLPELRQRSCTLGRQVLVSTPLGSRQGEAVDIDPGGELLVRFETGLERVTAGEVSVRGLLGYQP